MQSIYFLSPERKTPTPPVTTDKGTNNKPAKTPAGNPINGTVTSFAKRAKSAPASAAEVRKKAGAPTPRAPATTGKRRGAPSTSKGATPLMRICWLDATRESAPVSSIAGRSFSIAARSRPRFSSLERIPYSAVSPRMSSSRTRLTTSY